MNEYRKKPIVIHAAQLTQEIFDAPHPNDLHIPGVEYDPVLKCAWIKTLEGTMCANLGDWIIRGVKGELYSCRDDIFAATYEPANLAAEADAETDALRARVAELEAQWAAVPWQVMYGLLCAMAGDEPGYQAFNEWYDAHAPQEVNSE